ncbi:TP53-regulating kinase [Brachionus plicatilis]|uniref:non-specific serine/threonine protein kinase n=1 Tax=Brachionus plicatilis TaxID=10195 RepID=A0A3M7P710_BRAPC|nr:TP53-regulating kinase [Brachionus plicatilis]
MESVDNSNLANLSNLEILKNFELIKQGAEAKIYKGVYQNKECIIKERFKKTYRHPDLDKAITNRRTKMEVNLLQKASSFGINCPKMYFSEKENGIIVIEFIENSVTCREFILNMVKKNLPEEELGKKLKNLSVQIGKIVGKLHYNLIVHGDLTTSNFLIQNHEEEDYKIVVIDFGLSSKTNQTSQNEDKAVDLYVLERALLSTHSQQAELIFKNILAGYETECGSNKKQILDRLEVVRQRGRKRSMVG